MKIHKPLQFIIIFLVITAWLFSGFPRIWQKPAFPPKIQEAQAAITYFGSSSIPADNGSQDGVPTPSITPPTNMLAGDLAIMIVQGRGNYDLSIWKSGGQTWNTLAEFTDSSTITAQIFWARFNGTWSENPGVTGVGNNIAQTIVMHVFRPTSASNIWDVDVAQATGSFSAPSSPFDVTITGISTLTNGAVVLATWATADDNTWVLQTAGWSNAGGAMYRNLQGSDQSISSAYKIIPTAGESGNVTNRQTVNGGDAGVTSIVAFKEVAPLTTLGNGASEPSNTTIGPGASATDLDNFTLQTNTDTDTVTAATVSLDPAGAYNNIDQVDITDTSDVPQCTAVTGLTSNTVSFSTCNISVTTTETTYKVRITPKTHGNMDPPPGASYDTTGTVTDITCDNSKSLNDSGSATVTIDNSSPSDATWGTITPGDQQIELNWTNPGSDFYRVLILRKAGSEITDVPTEGQEYSAPGSIGDSTIIYVNNGTNFTDTGLNNGTDYYYKIFAYDDYINYASGSGTGPYTPSGAASTLTFSISDNTIEFGTLLTTATRWADDSGGSADEILAHTMNASTNGLNGYTITVDGNTLTHTNPSFTIEPIGGTALDVTAGTGTEQFGIRLTASGGNGTASAPYNGVSNYYAFDTGSFPDPVAADPDGDDVATTYSVFYATNIANTTEAGSYSAILTYIATGNF